MTFNIHSTAKPYIQAFIGHNKIAAKIRVVYTHTRT